MLAGSSKYKFLIIRNRVEYIWTSLMVFLAMAKTIQTNKNNIQEKFMNEPLISIIIPIYNGEKYIDKCLSNVVAQTYKNLEILCVINGTTDLSEEKVREWMQKDERIRILVTDVADLGHASNLGIENTTGPYLSFVDVDDWVEPEYIEKLYGGIKKGYKICKGNCIMYDGVKNLPAYQGRSSGEISIRGASFLLPCRTISVYDRSLFEKLRYLEFYYYEDLSLWPILIATAGCVYYINDIVYNYNQTNETSIMTVRNEKHLVLDKVFAHIFSNLTPDLDREVNLLITALFIQSFWTSNYQYVPKDEVGQAYLRRVKQVVDNRLVGYYYIVENLPVPKEMKERMIRFYRN